VSGQIGSRSEQGVRVSIERNIVCPEAFNAGSNLPYELRSKDFEIAMQDIYDFGAERLGATR